MLIEAIAKLIAKPAVANWIIKRAMRTPDEHLDGYMNRYWLFNQYNRETHAPRFPWIPFSIRVHHILREDLDRHHHDHPWNARTVILRGAYWECRQVGNPNRGGPEVHYYRGPGDTATLKFGEYHNIGSVSWGGVWTLFIMGRYRGRWGFLVDGKKIDFKTYLGDKQ